MMHVLHRALCIVKSAKTCGKLCVLDVAQSSVRGTCPMGILQHRAWVAGFLPGLAKLCVLWGCPNLNGALCIVGLPKFERSSVYCGVAQI